MILHLTFDGKVISRAIEYFEESLPGQNKFIIFPNGDNYKYVTSNKPFVFYTKYGTKEFWKIVGDVNQYNHILLHFLWPEMVDFVLKIPAGRNITWMVQGADLYKYLLEARGYQLYANPEDVPRANAIKKLIFAPIVYLRSRFILYRRIRAIKKIRYVGILEGDFKLLQQYYPEFTHLKKKQFFYYPVDDIIGNISFCGELGNNIIVGNSASYTNNHRYVLEQLSNLDLGERKVIVPLSYGTAKDYVLKNGAILKDNFCPLTQFLPLDEYNKILVSARTFIYGHFRQEAFGNILIALYIGGSVFLDRRNPLYTECVDAGYTVFSLDQLASRIDYRLTDIEKKTNRDIILKNYNHELLLSYIKNSFGGQE